jgi:hypothetical protein
VGAGDRGLFAPRWDELADKSALGAAREATLNMASGGATAVSVSGDDGLLSEAAWWAISAGWSVLEGGCRQRSGRERCMVELAP